MLEPNVVAAHEPPEHAVAGRETERVRVELATAHDASAWDAYVDGRSGATVHHRFAWKLVAERAYRLKAPFVIARDVESGAIRGVLPLIRVPRPFASYLATGLFGAYGRLLADDEACGRALVAHAVERVASGEASHLHLKLIGDAPRGLPLEHRDIWVTAKLDLDPDPDALWRRVPRKIRSGTRRAREAGLELARGPGELDGFYEVLFENMRRKGAPGYGRRFFASALALLAPHAQVLTLRHRGRAVSGAFLAWSGGTLYVPFASSLVDYFKLGVNNLLYTELVAMAYACGCHTIDFGSSIRGSSGLEFKLHWRPYLEPITSYVYAARGQPKLDPRESAIAKVVVAGWKRLPRGAARVLGPQLCRWIA